MAKRLSILIVVGLLLAVAGYLFKVSRIDAAAAKVRENFRAVLRTDLASVKAPEYVNGMVDLFHDDAFEKAFARRHATGGTIHITDYERSMVRAMIDKARADKAVGVVDELTKFAAARGLIDDPAPDSPAPDGG